MTDIRDDKPKKNKLAGAWQKLLQKAQPVAEETNNSSSEGPAGELFDEADEKITETPIQDDGNTEDDAAGSGSAESSESVETVIPAEQEADTPGSVCDPEDASDAETDSEESSDKALSLIKNKHKKDPANKKPAAALTTAQKNKRIIHVLIIISLLFMSIIVYLTWFEMIGKEDIINDPHNMRIWESRSDTLRGSIYDRDGNALAYSEFYENDSGETMQRRIYPYDNLYSHVIGYNSQNYGKSLLEIAYNDQLQNLNTPDLIANITSSLAKRQKSGNDLWLTIDHELQALSDDLIDEYDYNGAIVALDPDSGAILSLVSKPDFDPNTSSMAENWEDLKTSDDSPLFARAFQSTYAPGSTFKLLPSIAAIDNGQDDFTCYDEGSVVIDGQTFSNADDNQYGWLDLNEALAHSSNVYFSQLGVELGKDILNAAIETAGFNEDIPFDLNVEQSTCDLSDMGDTGLASTAMGQGNLQVTPMYMAMLTAAIANDGEMMEPYLVEKIVNAGDKTIYEHEPAAWRNITSAETADALTDMMVDVVDYGTGTNAQIYGVNVAGKTGTAENETDMVHSWFVGFAPAEDPQIAVAVLLEYNGSYGGDSAAPIAGRLMDFWLSNHYY